MITPIKVVKTGMYWVRKSDLTDVQISQIQRQYTYQHPKDEEDTFYTFIETDDKIGVPTGDTNKLKKILNNVTVEDRTVVLKFDTPVKSDNLVLRDYQETAMQEIQDYFNSGGTTFNLAGKPGSGKSYMLAALLAKMKMKVLIVAHLTSLIDQIKNEIETATGMTVTVLNAKNTVIGDINVATSQFISRNTDVWYQIKTGIGMLVIDESESAASLSTLRIIQRCYAKYRVFISATFSRSVDDRTEALKDVAGHKRITLHAQDMLNPTVIQVQCPEIFNNPVNKNLYQKAKGVFFKNPGIDEKVILVTKASIKKDRQVLIAVDIIDVQNRLKQKLEADGITCGIMNGETKAKDRVQILQDYNDGKIKVLLGVNVLNAGLSIPKITTIVKVSIPSSSEKLEQLIGRLRRKFEGKQGAWFIDLHFKGFKCQKSFYVKKVREESWKYHETTWDAFVKQISG